MPNIQDVTGAIQYLGCYLKRFSASFGFNTAPSTVELELIQGRIGVAEDEAIGATGFQYNQARPGNVLTVSVGNFDFCGIIQSWTQSYSSQGESFNVRLADPRFAFSNIQVLMNGLGLSSGINLPNYLNMFGYYGNPVNADTNINGTTFYKVREYLETTGIFNLYGKKFILDFSDGFSIADATGSVGNYVLINPSGVPKWYRLQSSSSSIDQIIQQTSNDMGMDWYAYIDPSTYNPNGVSPIKIQHIYRTDLEASTTIQALISGYQASGLQINYKRGEELRTDPTTAIVLGPPKTFWRGFNTSDVETYWGRLDEGSIITRDIDNPSGVVILNHIVGTGSELITNTITLPIRTVQKVMQTGVYPPRTSIVASTINISGYYVHPTVMRAALYNQESWECMLFKYQQSFAQSIGIRAQKMLDHTSYANQIAQNQNITQALKLSLIGRDISIRSQAEENLIKAVYDATRAAVDNFWGKSWVVSLPTSQWLINSSFDHSDLFPTIEYSIATAAWSEGPYPSGVENHVLLNDTNKPIFKDDNDRLKAFMSITDYDTGGVNFPYPVDLSKFERSKYLIEQGDKLVVPISVEQYEKQPTKAIIQTEIPIEGLTITSGFINQRFFIDFMVDFGYSIADMYESNLLNNANDNQVLGLAPPRLTKFDTAPSNYGPHIPLQSNEFLFGGFYASGLVPGGVSIIQDSTLGPWTYGGYAPMSQAGQQLANRAVANETIVDFGDLTLAGFPMFNIGEIVGLGGIVAGVNMQYGADGITTSHSFRSYLNLAKPTRLLTDKIIKIFNDIEYQKRQLVNLNDLVSQEEVKKVEKLKDIPQDHKPTDRTRNQTQDDGYLLAITIGSNNGVYNSDNNTSNPEAGS